MSGSSPALKSLEPPSGLRHLGALRQLGHAAEMPDRHGFDHVPLGDGVEQLLDVGRIEQLEAHIEQLEGGPHMVAERVVEQRFRHVRTVTNVWRFDVGP